MTSTSKFKPGQLVIVVSVPEGSSTTMTLLLRILRIVRKQVKGKRIRTPDDETCSAKWYKAYNDEHQRYLAQYVGMPGVYRKKNGRIEPRKYVLVRENMLELLQDQSLGDCDADRPDEQEQR